MSKDPDKSPLKFPGKPSLWLAALMVLLLLVEIPLLISHARHAYFKIDGWFAFYALLGIGSCFLIAILSRGLRKFLRREESFYGDVKDETQPEDLDERIR